MEIIFFGCIVQSADDLIDAFIDDVIDIIIEGFTPFENILLGLTIANTRQIKKMSFFICWSKIRRLDLLDHQF